jgi:hypothetical protein
MRRTRQLTAFFLALIMTFFLVMQWAGGPAADVPSDWAQAEIDAARAKGLILSPADRNYQANISRVLFCMQIVNMVETIQGAPVTLTITNPFSDISSAYVTKAYQLGIVTGRAPTVFDPNAYITRQENRGDDDAQRAGARSAGGQSVCRRCRNRVDRICRSG